jgi:hypothetical protein
MNRCPQCFEELTTTGHVCQPRVTRVPHKCPVCDGEGRIPSPMATGTGNATRACPACKGECVVWDEVQDVLRKG